MKQVNILRNPQLCSLPGRARRREGSTPAHMLPLHRRLVQFCRLGMKGRVLFRSCGSMRKRWQYDALKLRRVLHQNHLRSHSMHPSQAQNIEIHRYHDPKDGLSNSLNKCEGTIRNRSSHSEVKIGDEPRIVSQHKHLRAAPPGLICRHCPYHQRSGNKRNLPNQRWSLQLGFPPR